MATIDQFVKCHGDSCAWRATHGPSGEPVACWQHAGSWPRVVAVPPRPGAPMTRAFDHGTLGKARARLASQVFRYADKHGIPDSVHRALRDTLAPDGLSPLPSQQPLVDALGAFLAFDGGDYGLRRAFDAFAAEVRR